MYLQCENETALKKMLIYPNLGGWVQDGDKIHEKNAVKMCLGHSKSF